MKKILALVLALVMVFALVACGAQTEKPAAAPAPTEEPAAPAPTEKAATPGATPLPAAEPPAAEEGIVDSMTSSDGKYKIAFVTDIGQLKDGSFNEGTWNGVKQYASENGLSYKYYQPAGGYESTDDDRYDAMKAAAENGAEAIVCAGYLQAAALERVAKEFPDVKFVFIDGWPLGLDNVAAVAFEEEQCGYLAGYAAVMEGYTKLGFSGGGGGTNAACCRYGSGYVQGASAAAQEKGIEVEVNYTWQYGGNFQPSAELQTLMSGWYENGTEVVFACGGPIFDSITAAAAANDGAVIGVDVDQSPLSDTVITSALKGIGEAAYQALTAAFDGSWGQTFGGADNLTKMGAAQGAVGLPVDTWSLQNWSVADYEAMFAKIVSGELSIDSTVYENGEIADVGLPNVTVNYV